MNFKLEFNNDIHVLSQKPASLFELKSQIRDLYDDLKKVENFKIQYKDKEDFMMTIQNEQDYAYALQMAKEIEKPSFKLFILPDHANSQFGLINTNFNLKTPSTTSEFVPTGRPRFFPYDTSNTTSSDEKMTGRESFMPDQDREKATKSSGDVNVQEKSKGNPFKMEELGFIRMEEEKVLKYSVENNKEDIKNELNEKKTKKKMEFISSQNAFNRLEKFTSVKCYKCKGKGLNPSKNNKKCKKCKGTGDFSNSVKSSVIDYFIKEKLGNIYKEFEQKLSQSDPYKSKFFASETTNNTYNNTNSSFGICTQCGVNIDGPHKFKCTKCPLLTLCDKCEENFDHPHSLTKVKRSIEENKLNFSKSVQLNYPFSSTDSSQLNKSISKKAFESLDPVPNKLCCSTSTPYKAKFLNEHFTEKVPLGAQFTMFFTIQNNGDNKWPDFMEFICISGYFQGTSVAVPSLEMGDKYTVNLNLIAPKKEETLSSSWRLAYANKNDKKFFGPKINSTVLAMKPEKMVLKESAKEKEIKKKFVSH